jgi:catechol 2,3-dioxygenase-like lactoylglutathione lyase family enzyme
VVDDLEGQRRFWGDLLGVPEDHSGADFVAFELGDGRSFELIERSTEPQYDRLRFQVGFDVENIEAAREELVRRGVEQIGEIFPDEESPWAYFRDPEGNVFEIKQRQGRTVGT